MAAAIPLRKDYDGPQMRRLAKGSKDAKQTRRLLALASIYDGGSRSAAAELGGVTPVSPLSKMVVGASTAPAGKLTVNTCPGCGV